MYLEYEEIDRERDIMKIKNMRTQIMTLTTYLVDIVSIKATIKKEYNEALIEKLAFFLIKEGGTTMPLIVTQTGVDQYELIEGEIVYLAALKAYKDSYLEKIRVYIQKNTDLTKEKQLVAKIENNIMQNDDEVIYADFSEMANDLEYQQEANEGTETNNEASKEIITEATTKSDEPVSGWWLIVNDEFIYFDNWIELNKTKQILTKVAPDLNPKEKLVYSASELSAKKNKLLAELAEVELELEAIAKVKFSKKESDYIHPRILF